MSEEKKLTKCDFCTKSQPNGKCWWHLQSIREEDCKKAIKSMVKALGRRK